MAEKLTPQQAQVVADRGGKLLVSAAAGSGKTKVLVDRLLRYVTDPVSPANLDDFLIITYTKAAAAELRGKIAAKLTERIAEEPSNRHLQRQMQRLYLTKISTVHAFCADILREYAYRLDLSADFRVGDENECRELRTSVMQQLLDDAYADLQDNPDFQTFIDTQGIGRNDAQVPELVQSVYDSARCHLDPKHWLQSCLHASDLDDISDAGQTVWGKYLMDELYAFLDGQIDAMTACTEMLRGASGLEKPAAVFADNVYQLEVLRAAKSWDEIVDRIHIDFGRLTFPRKGADPELTERVKAVRDAMKDGLEKHQKHFTDDSATVLEDLSQSAGAIRGLLWLVDCFSERYDKAKRNRRILDFADLEHRMLDLLLGKQRSGATSAAAELGARFREIMVDEYQDSNAVQDAIFNALTAKRSNLFMVGDVKQSIYQFRLADPGIFLEKYRRFVPADEAQPGQSRKILLSHNFRSAGAVIEAVNDVFGACMSDAVGGLHYGEDEALREGIPHIPVPEPEVEFHLVSVREHTYPEEAAYIAQRVSELLDGTHMIRQGSELRPITADDIVILLRSPGSIGSYYQTALEQRGFRCNSGGGTDLLQTPEIQALRALLQTICNPRQDIPLITALSSPLFGYTADDLAALRAKHKRGNVYDALLADDSEKSVRFLKTLESLRQEARMNPLPALLEKIFALTRLEAIFAAMPGGEAKCANLRSFFQLASDFDSVSRRDLGQFLEHLEGLEEKGLQTAAEQGTGAVTIMSIHKSKGLEFPVVFLAGLSKAFNREYAKAPVLCHKTLGLGMNCVDTRNRVRYPSVAKRAIIANMNAESISEELRVLYVAMTRARDRLIMTHAVQKPEKKLQMMTARMGCGKRELLTADVTSAGEWVLYAALQRTEAGLFHNLGGRPAQTVISEHPWKICVGEAPLAAGTGTMQTEQTSSVLPDGVLESLQTALAYKYPHAAATKAPSKQTATGKKGRMKDQEAAELAAPPKSFRRNWRKPSFMGAQVQGKSYGTAVHTLMQYINFSSCGSEEGVRAEVQRLVEAGCIAEDLAALVNCRKITGFFSTAVGKKLMTSSQVLREFKFSMLDSGAGYGEGLADERVLLQGVVDCAVIEDDGITIVDFKTDHVTQDTLPGLVSHYRPQVQTYAEAMERIYEKRVKAAYLYFFHLDRLVEV